MGSGFSSLFFFFL
uniref:Uncharacterized protein n=1 Tax=Rhizophora mucronata TaxID=61149 RepID=A0A2P2P4J2_RHIMU